MSRSIKKGLIGAVTGLAMAVAGAASAETLGAVLTDAYTNSGLLAQNRAVLRAADEDVAQAMASLRPVVRWTGSVQREFGSSTSRGDFATESATARLVASYTLYDGGSNKLNVELAKEAVLATRESLRGVEQQVLLRAVRAFMEVRRAIETVALRENNVRVISQELRAARDRFEVGEVTRTDVALAEARLAAARSALSGARGNLDIAIEEFRVAVGRAPGNLVPPTTLPRIPGTEAEATQIAVRNHPDIRQAQRDVTVAAIRVAIARAALKPTVELEGSYGLTETFGSDNYSRGGSIGITGSGPIYQGGQLASQIREAQAREDQARAALHIIRLELQQRVGRAYAQLQVAQASRAAFESQVRAATVAFRGVREEATLGARTTLDVLDAEQELQDARTDLVSAQVDETIAAYSVLAAIGQLTANTLDLPVPDFDPAAYYRLVKDAPAAVSPQGRELDRVLRALGKD